MSSPWLYHGLSRLEAETLLVDSRKSGAFLLRESETVPGSYVLSLARGEGHVHHYRIMRHPSNNRFFIQAVMGMKQTFFDSLEDLVAYYKGPNTGLACPLVHAIAKCEEEDEDTDDDNESETDECVGVTKMAKFFQMSFASLKVQEKTRVDSPFFDYLTRYVNDGIVKDVESMKTEKKAPNFKEMLKVAGKELETSLNAFRRRVKAMQSFFDHCTGGGGSDRNTETDGLAQSLMECSLAVSALEKKSESLLKDTVEMMTPTPAPEDVTPFQLTSERQAPMPAPPSLPMQTFEVSVIYAASLGRSKLLLHVNVVEGKLIVTKAGKADPSNVFAHNQIIQLIKSRSNNTKLGIRFDKSRRDFHFEDTKRREVFCQLIQQMRNMHSENEEVDSLSIFIGSWNMGDAEPSNILSWLKCSGSGKALDPTLSCLPHDIYAIGTQETSMSEKEWIAKIKSSLKICVSVDFKQVAVATLWGIRLVVLTKSDHINKISHVQQSSVKTGIAGALGNKGAVGISFFFNGASLCFVNSHLTSGNEKCHRRNSNYYDILRGLQLGQATKKSVFDLSHRFHHLFWFGDLNYRVECGSFEEVLGYISRRDYKGLLEHDQLLKEQKRGKAFDSFDEEEIGFQPTYRYARGTRQKYDYRKMKKTYVRINLPSYCDRVLWKSYPETSITNTSYGCTDDIMTSDHSPVFATFTVGAVTQYTPDGLSSSATQKDLEFRVDRIAAMIQTSSASPFYLEIHSTCINEPIRSKNSLSQPQRAGRYFMTQYRRDESNGVKYSSPVWGADDFEQKIYPIISAKEYLEQQHLLIAVKSAEGDESYGECVISLKQLLSDSWNFFESQLSHRGVHTGMIRGDMKTVTEGAKETIRPRSSYELIQNFISDDHDHDNDEGPEETSPPTSRFPTRKPVTTPPRSRSVRVSKGMRAKSVADDVDLMISTDAVGPPPPTPARRPDASSSSSDRKRREVPIPLGHEQTSFDVTDDPPVPPLPSKERTIPRYRSPAPPLPPEPYSASNNVASSGRRSPAVAGSLASSTLSSSPHVQSGLAAAAAAKARAANTIVTSAGHSSPGKTSKHPPLRPKPKQSLSKQEIAVLGWLSRIDSGLEKYVPHLVRSGWDDPSFFDSLSDDDLFRAGITNAFHRRQIVQAIHGRI
ncbi:phosphatidylinositol 3,4,5-trisphosphate 5-phosphatase 2-like [Oscarella lobularis]|uniref:phosphatidylinositol 3,4,5-trisphosphate 5-phosphatase 2-like n=1 Tax=Oscarella lobularis TaxID=121494 RepID=UPI003313C79A